MTGASDLVHARAFVYANDVSKDILIKFETSRLCKESTINDKF